MQMPGKNIFTNRFNGGMRSDRAQSAQQPNTYTDALNGDIVFTGAGDAEFSNEKGNVAFADMLPSGFIPVGGKERVSDSILYSFNPDTGYSEIGILVLDPDGVTPTYTTIFNDEFDPNGDLLGFSDTDLIKNIEHCIESEDKSRVYWNRKNSEVMAMDTLVGKTSISEEFVDGDYTKLSTTDKYPWFYSVHSMALQPDVRMGLIKLKDTTIRGALKTGMYELSYRYVTRSGYRTPWSPLTRHFFVTLDPELESMHDRSMYASNVMTSIGYRFTISGVDLRFYQLEVAYVYSTDKDVTVEASIFYREKINPDGGTDVDVDFTATTGIAVAIEEFNRYIVPVRRAGTIGQQDNRLWVGEVQTYGPFELDLSGVTVAPYLRQMKVDETTDETETPLTDVAVSNEDLTQQLYIDRTGVPATVSFPVTEDYPNYKGVQFEHLFSSYPGGETISLALLVWDLKGNPWFAQHITDYTLPNRYDGNGTEYQLMQGTDYANLNIMGLKVNGINLTDILYDADGKLQVSGVQIVRCKNTRPRILGQGLLLPTVIEKNSTDEDLSTQPLPSCSNDFHEPYTVVPDSRLYHDIKSNTLDIASRPYTHMFLCPDLLFERNIFDGTSQEDVVFDADRMDLVALYGCPYNIAVGMDNAIELSGELMKYYTKNVKIEDPAGGNMLFAYGTKSRVKRMQTVILFNEYDSTGYDEDNTELKFRNDANIDDPDGGECGNPHSQGVRNVWILKTKDYKTLTYYKDGAAVKQPKYYVANYIVNQPDYITENGQSSLEQRLYIGTGHFQPINDEVLEAIRTADTYIWTFDDATFTATEITITINGDEYTSPTIASVSAFTTWLNTLGLGNFGSVASSVSVSNASNTYGDIVIASPAQTLEPSVTEGDQYILNGVEVWGGDCYPWLFDFVRLYPKPGDCSNSGGCWGDYGIGVIVPLESRMNMALRRGRNFAGKGIRSQAEACGEEDPEIFPDGIMQGQPEEFYLNSVVLHETNVQSFISKPASIDPVIINYSGTWIYSLLKIKGEVADQYRVFLTGNRGEMDLRYGKIIGKAYFGDNMYCLQERGLFRLRINELTALSTEAGDAVSTGTPEVWQKPQPISVEHGCIHPYAIIQTPKAFYWPDYYSKSFCRFAQDGVTNLSVRCEIKQWSYDNLKYMNTEDSSVSDEIRHIAGGYDPIREKIYWSLYGLSRGTALVNTTICYSADEHINSFVSRMGFVQYIYATAAGLLISASIDDPGNWYVHGVGNRGEYNGSYQQTKIKFIQNPLPDANKLFDNSWTNINEDGYDLLTKINWVTDNQEQSLTISGDTRSKYKNLLFTTPTMGRDVSGEHLSGKTMATELIFTNGENKLIALTSHDQSFRLIAKVR